MVLHCFSLNMFYFGFQKSKLKTKVIIQLTYIKRNILNVKFDFSLK